MTNEELQKIMSNPNPISDEDFDKIWADVEARNERKEAEWNALSTRKRSVSSWSLHQTLPTKE